MKIIASIVVSMFVFASCFAQMQIASIAKEEALSSPVVVHPGKGVVCEISSPKTESSNENAKAVTKMTFPNGETSFLTAPDSFDVSVIMPSYAPATPLNEAKISYNQIGNGFNVSVKTKNDHFKLQFEKKDGGGQLKVQCGEREWVIPFKSEQDFNSIENNEEALNSVYESFKNSPFYKSALDTICSELKKRSGEWEKDFRISVLQIMNIVFTNEFFDPSSILPSSIFVYVKICVTDKPIKITIDSGGYVVSYTLVKGCMSFNVNPGTTVTIE